MARLYSDEQFPKVVSELLRMIGHDVLTVQEAGNANLGIPDDEVLAFAVTNNRAVMTLNRQDFAQLHRQILTMQVLLLLSRMIWIGRGWQLALTKQ
jgi:predicted nuclease of predicted toxin-antitoxin system